MMRGANDTITIWNKIREGTRDVWYRHIVPNCSWEQKAVRNVTGSTANLANRTSVLITENPEYLPAKEWAAADKAAFFTLNNGDLVARGKHNIEITGVSPFTEAMVKISLMPEVFNIHVVQDNAAEYKSGKHYYIEELNYGR